jgi:hypothetical protein
MKKRMQVNHNRHLPDLMEINTLRSGRPAADDDNAARRPDGSQRAAVTNAQTRLRKRWSWLLGVSWLQAVIEFFGFLWTHHSHVGDVRSA